MRKNAQGLTVALKAACFTHTVVQRDYSAMSEGRMAEVVTEPRSLNQIARRQKGMSSVLCLRVVELIGNTACDLCYFERMGEARAVFFAVSVFVFLGFVLFLVVCCGVFVL